MHARITCMGMQGYSIADLGSPSGTYANGVQLREPSPLVIGVEYRLGAACLSLMPEMPVQQPQQMIPQMAPQVIPQVIYINQQAPATEKEKHVRLSELTERELDVLSTRYHAKPLKARGVLFNLTVAVIFVGGFLYAVLEYAPQEFTGLEPGTAGKVVRSTATAMADGGMNTVRDISAEISGEAPSAPRATSAPSLRSNNASSGSGQTPPAASTNNTAPRGVQPVPMTSSGLPAAKSSSGTQRVVTAMGTGYRTSYTSPAAMGEVKNVVSELPFINAEPATDAKYYIYVNTDCFSEWMHFLPQIAEAYPEMKRAGVELLYFNHDNSEEETLKQLRENQASFPSIARSAAGVDFIPQISNVPERHAAFITADGALITRASIVSVPDWKNILFPVTGKHEMQSALRRLNPLGCSINRSAKCYLYLFPDSVGGVDADMRAMQYLAALNKEMKQRGVEPILFIPSDAHELIAAYQRHYKDIYPAVELDCQQGLIGLPGFLYKRNTVVSAQGKALPYAGTMLNINWREAARKADKSN